MFEISLIIIVVIVFYAVMSSKNIKYTNDKKKDNNTYIPPVTTTTVYTNTTPAEPPLLYPYKRKYLLTKAEYSFYKILKNRCDFANMIICPKVRLEDFISVSTKDNVNKYRGYIKSRHVDFVICDNDLNILVAVELDDNSHNTAASVKTDDFKNKLFQTVGIPLIRIKMSDGYYEKAIDNMLKTAQSLIKHK